MQPPPQHPSIRARNAPRAVDHERPAPSPLQSAASSHSAEHGPPVRATASEPVLRNVVSTPPRLPQVPPRHPDAFKHSIASALRETATTATLAVPHANSSPANGGSPNVLRSPSPSLPPSPGISRSSTSNSLNGSRPSISLYGDSKREEDVASAFQELRQLELDDFLERMSKTIGEVNFEGPPVGSELPSLAAFIDSRTGKTDYIAFAERYACAFADTNLPRDLVTSTRPNKFSFSRTRAGLERLYVLLPPVVLEQVLAGDLVKLYRWHDPIKTGKYALAYLACWYYDQIPAAFYAWIAYKIVQPRIWPLSPSEVRRKLAHRRLRSKEAHELDKDISRRQAASQLSHSIASSVGIAAVMGGINIQTPKLSDDDDSDFDDDLRHTLGSEKRPKGKYGLYKLVRELVSRFGPAIELLIVDQADFAEKVKNLILWRRPAATKQSLVVICLCSVILSIMPGHLQLKLLLLWIWFQFFFVWPCQDRHPQYRRAMNPFWYLLWNVPNDTECALELLRERAHQPRDTDGHRSSLDSLAPLPSRRSRSISSMSTVPMSLLDSGISRHFALYKGIPGHLILTETELLFNSMKGFRSLSSKLFKNLSGYNTPTEDGEKTTTLFRDFLINIHSVKKEARFEIGIFDTDGLHLQFTSGKVVRLASVAQRDEAFATILARSTQQRSYTSTPG